MNGEDRFARNEYGEFDQCGRAGDFCCVNEAGELIEQLRDQVVHTQPVASFLEDLVNRAYETGEAGGNFEHRTADDAIVARCRVTVELIDP